MFYYSINNSFKLNITMKTKIKCILLLLIIVTTIKAQTYEWNVNINTAMDGDTIIQYPNSNTNYVNLLGYNWSCSFDFDTINKYIKLDIGGSNIIIGKTFNKYVYDSQTRLTFIDSTDVYAFTSILPDSLVVWNNKVDYLKINKNSGITDTVYIKSLFGTNFPFKYPAINLIDSANTTGVLNCRCIFYK